MNSPDSSHWSDYWASGYLTSLPQDFSSNYDGEIAAFWRRQFREVPTGGSVLDLCTGNGAVALLAARHALDSGQEYSVSAVDAARMDTAAMTARHPGEAAFIETIGFIGECRVEELSMADASVDLVTSQYGIEYCDWDAAATQVARVLRPGGRLVMLCHESSSEIISYMQQEQAEYAFMRRLGFADEINAFLEDRQDAVAFKAGLRRVETELGPAWKSSHSPFLQTNLKVLTIALSLDEPALADYRTRLAEFRDHLRQGELRLADLLRVNRALHDQPEWYEVFCRAGLRLEDQGELLYRGVHHSGHFHCFEHPSS